MLKVWTWTVDGEPLPGGEGWGEANSHNLTTGIEHELSLLYFGSLAKRRSQAWH